MANAKYSCFAVYSPILGNQDKIDNEARENFYE